jgi:hypothetical protein
MNLIAKVLFLLQQKTWLFLAADWGKNGTIYEARGGLTSRVKLFKYFSLIANYRKKYFPHIAN